MRARFATSLTLALGNVVLTSLALLLIWLGRYPDWGAVWLITCILPLGILTLVFSARDIVRRKFRRQGFVAVLLAVPLIVWALSFRIDV